MSRAAGHRFGLHFVAIYEATKGLVVLVLGSLYLYFNDRDWDAIGEKMVQLFRLNPEGRIPHLFLNSIDFVSDQNLAIVATLILSYSLLRFVEAYGLWKQMTWGEWLAIVSGGLYLPFEFYEIHLSFSWFKAFLISGNVALVLYLLWLRMIRATPPPESKT